MTITKHTHHKSPALRHGCVQLLAPEIKTRVRLAVLQRIHLAMAGIESRRIAGEHTEWPSVDAMNEDYDGLCACREELLSGVDLASTQNPRLFALRELALSGGTSHVLHDAEYVLCDKGAWIKIGAVNIRIERDDSLARVAVYPLGGTKYAPLAVASVDFAAARARFTDESP